jgi:hypothetical protein
MFKKSRALSAIVGVICAVALTAMGATALAAAKKPKGKADSGTSFVGTTHTSGNTDYTAGAGPDKLFGQVAVTYQNKVLPGTPGTLKVTAKPVVLYTSTGTLRGSGSATLTIGAGGNATVTNGKLNLTKGTGALKGHTWVGTFTGSGNVVTGQYVFHYKGKYR